MKCCKLFNKQDLLDIEKEVASVERVTSGEIVPVITNKSSKYRSSELVASILFSYLFVFIVYELNSFLFWNNKISIFGFIIISFVGVILALLMFRSDLLKKIIINKKIMDQKVHDSAFSVFYKYGVNKTKNKTGILIYISLFEKKVVVIADEGINSKVKQTDWNNVVDIIIKGIRTKKAKQGIIDGVESCRSLLKESFPVLSDDVNELNNSIIIIDN